MTKRRVVITGLGMVSPVGNNVSESWKNILAGNSGVSLVDTFDTSEFASRIAGTVKNFEPSAYLSPKEIRKTAIFAQYAIAAAAEAVNDADLTISATNAHRIGVALGAGMGGLSDIEKNYQAWVDGGPRRIAPSFIPGAIINVPAGMISIRYGLKGPNIAIVTACTTGAHNIGYAARTIQYGDADVMLTGGAEMATSILGLGGFSSMRALSTRNDEPEKASRPWDKDRDGFVLGEGAGVLVLEEYEMAKQRGANIYAELIGFGASADAYHMTLPEQQGDGFASSIKVAMQDANINPDEVGYVNAHATSTPAGDEVEALAVKKAFGDHAYKLAVSSTKSMTGHLLGGAGAVEAIFTVLALRDQVVPPTINLDNPSEGCDLDFVPHTSRDQKLNVTVSNSFGFGGTNGTLVFKKL